MLRCMTPAVFLRFVTLASVVAVIYSDGSHHRRHRLDLLPSQQLATTKTSPYLKKAFQNELDGGGGSIKRVGFLAVVEGSASGGEGSVSPPTVREASDRSRAEESTGPFHQHAGKARRSRRTAESKAPTPAPAKAGTGPLSFPPTTVTRPLAPTATADGTSKTLIPVSTATPTATEPPVPDPTASATPTPLRETPGPTPVPAALQPTMEPNPFGASPAPTAVPVAAVVPATPQPTTAHTVVPESPAATPVPTIKPTLTPAEMPATPSPAIEPTVATGIDHSPAPQTPDSTVATGIDHSPAPQTPEEEVSPSSPKSTPKPTVAPPPVADADQFSNAGGDDDTDKSTAAGGGVTDADNASDDGGDMDPDDSVEPQASGSGQVTGGDGGDGGDEFVVGTGLDSGEKQKIVIGVSVIGSLAVALVAAACFAKRYNAKVSGLDEDYDDDVYGGLARGRPGRLQTRKALPTFRISPGSRTMDI